MRLRTTFEALSRSRRFANGRLRVLKTLNGKSARGPRQSHDLDLPMVGDAGTAVTQVGPSDLRTRPIAEVAIDDLPVPDRSSAPKNRRQLCSEKFVNASTCHWLSRDIHWQEFVVAKRSFKVGVLFTLSAFNQRPVKSYGGVSTVARRVQGPRAPETLVLAPCSLGSEQTEEKKLRLRHWLELSRPGPHSSRCC